MEYIDGEYIGFEENAFCSLRNDTRLLHHHRHPAKYLAWMKSALNAADVENRCSKKKIDIQCISFSRILPSPGLGNGIIYTLMFCTFEA